MYKSIFIFLLCLSTVQLASRDTLKNHAYLRAGTGLMKDVSFWYEFQNKTVVSVGFIHGLTLLGPECSHWVSDEGLRSALRRGISLRAGYNFKDLIGFSLTPIVLYRYQFRNNLRQQYPNQNCYEESRGTQISDTEKHSFSGLLYFDFDRKGKKRLSFYAGFGMGLGFSKTLVKSAFVFRSQEQMEINRESNERYPHFIIDIGLKIRLNELMRSTTP